MTLNLTPIRRRNIEPLSRRHRKVRRAPLLEPLEVRTLLSLSTNTSLSASAASPLQGQVETFTATVAPQSPATGTPTGTVTFYDGLLLLGTAALSTSGGVTTATLATATLPTGTHSISAVYGGDATFGTSDSRTVSTYAGGGTTPFFRGDGGPARLATFLNPDNIAVDRRNGNIYIADYDDNSVREVHADDGTVTTVAGDGTAGYSGDGGPATSAQLSGPNGVAVDAQGNLFIADFGNSVVRRVDTDGFITTFAGDGISGYSGDHGRATSAQLAGPAAVAFDATGNLYIADYFDNVIRRVDGNGTITTVAGDGIGGDSGDGGPATSAQLGGVYGMTFDASGNLFFADTTNQVIWRVDSNGTITTVAGDGTQGYGGDGGLATSAQLANPSAVAVDAAGNLFIADTGNNAIRRVGTDGKITTVAGDGTAGYSGDGGPAALARLASPNDLTFDAAGNLLLVDENNLVLRAIHPDGSIATVAGTGTWGGVGPATEAMLAEPLGLAVDAAGNLYIADRLDNVVRRVDGNGTITTVAGDGYREDYAGGPAIRTYLNGPNDIAVGPTGDLLVRGWDSEYMYDVAPDGTTTILFSQNIGARFPAVTFDPQGNVVYSLQTPFHAQVSSFPVDEASPQTLVAGFGQNVSSGDGGPATLAGLNGPSAVAYDAAGDLFILTRDGVREVRPDNGIISTVYSTQGPVSFYQSRMAVDPQGDVYVLDPARNQVVEVRPDGTVTALIGDGTGIPIPQLYPDSLGPDLAADGAGNLFFSDPSAGVVYRLGGMSLVVSPVSVTSLQSALDSPSQAGAVTIQPTSDATVSSVVDAINALSTPAPGTTETVTLDLGGSTFTTDTHIQAPAGVTVVIVNGTLVGGSPALIVDSGNVLLQGVTARNATNAPTIVVNGGTLKVRGSTIDESTGYTQVAILINGGTVDLGTAGDPGNNTINVNGTGDLVQNASGNPVPAVGDTFTVNGVPLAPSSLSGVVFSDFNDDGQVDFGEQGIAGVTITLGGTDFLGNSLHTTISTDHDGAYVFSNLLPGHYTISEMQPAGYTQGINSVGTGGGAGSLDQFAVQLTASLDAMNYNYGEQPAATGAIRTGQTAGIGFWNNKNGQALIKALNGGVGTQLGDWLAATFPHMFGAAAGANDLAGKSNASVASFFQSRFVLKDQKLDAQVLATALAVYVTDGTLDSTGVGTKYGFIVGGNGVATATYNVSSNGAAFGVANNTVMTVMDLLLAVDAQAVDGVLYNGNTTKRNMANTVFGGINDAGGI